MNDEKMKQVFVKLSIETHAKISLIAKHVVGDTIQNVCITAIEQYIDRRFADTEDFKIITDKLSQMRETYRENNLPTEITGIDGE